MEGYLLSVELLAAGAGAVMAWIFLTGLIEAFAKPASMRLAKHATDRLLRGVPAALVAMDRVFPDLLAEGATGSQVEQRMRQFLEEATGDDWGAAPPEAQQQAVEEAFRSWDPRVAADFLRRAGNYVL